MTLVAGIFFWTTRRLMALSPTLALRYPIKKWAAIVAMIGSIAYDVCTGSRVGTQRALFMTLIVLGAVLVDRRALTMRNLALAVLAMSPPRSSHGYRELRAANRLSGASRLSVLRYLFGAVASWIFSRAARRARRVRP